MRIFLSSFRRPLFIFGMIFSVFSVAAGSAADRDTLFSDLQPSLHMAFEEIVVTATRTHLPVWRSPVPAIIVTAADIERRGGINLSDMLERSEALTLRRYGPGASLTTMSVRGMAADQTVILFNGIPLNSPQNGQVDLSTIPLHGIERVEITRGGASSLFGNNAMGGVVNIISRSADRYKSVADVHAGAGSYGLRRMNINSRISSSSFDLSVGLGRDQAEGDFSFADPLNGGVSVSRQNADYVQSFATLDGSFRVDGGTSIRLFSRYTTTDRGTPGAYYGSQSGDRQEDEHLHAAVAVTRVLAENITAELRPFLLYSDMLYSSPDFGYSSRSINRQYGAAFNMNMQATPALLLTFGGEISDAGVNADDLEGDVKRVNNVAYLSGEWKAPSIGGLRAVLFPSVRYDRFSNTHDSDTRRLYEEVTWKIGMTLQPFAYDRFLLRSSYGRNFKAPGLNDMYWMPGGNRDLAPERSLGFDAGIRGEFPIAGVITVDAGFFSIRTKDRIAWIEVDPETWLWSPVNLRTVHADGFEMDLRWRHEEIPLRLGISYTYQDVRQLFDGETSGGRRSAQLIYIPFHLIGGEIGYEFGGFRISVFTRYTGERYADEANDFRVEGFFMFDVRSDYLIDMRALRAMVTLDVKNVFNAEYQLVQNYPMPGRHYEMSVRFRI